MSRWIHRFEFRQDEVCWSVPSLKSFNHLFIPPIPNISDVNECNGEKGVSYNIDCHQCKNTIGSYTCKCNPGFELDPVSEQKCIGEFRSQLYHLKLCVDADIDECSRGLAGDGCHSCSNLIGSYTCTCKKYYKLDPTTNKTCIGKFCCAGDSVSHDQRFITDKDECKGTKGVDYDKDCHTCLNRQPGYSCECNTGYSLDEPTPNEGKCVGQWNTYFYYLSSIHTFSTISQIINQEAKLLIQ